MSDYMAEILDQILASLLRIETSLKRPPRLQDHRWREFVDQCSCRARRALSGDTDFGERGRRITSFAMLDATSDTEFLRLSGIGQTTVNEIRRRREEFQ